MRALLLLCAIAACGKPPPRPTDITTVPTNAPVEEPPPKGAPAPTGVPGTPITWKAGPGEFPIPSESKDAEMPGSAVTFVVPRGRDDVHGQLLQKMKQDGFVLDQEQMVMGGYRMNIHKAAQSYFVSVTENGDTESLFTVTAK